MSTITQSSEKVVRDVALQIELRDWFAGQDLTGLMMKDPWGDPDMHASYAYNAADALLAARQKGGDS